MKLILTLQRSLVLMCLGASASWVHAQLANVPSTQLPTAATVVSGKASVTSNASTSTMTINQSTQRSEIDWGTFNIGSAAKVNFVQPSASAVTLNRVMGSNPTQILGQLNATGQVFILNANGVYFGSTASVDVGGLVATTQTISNADFMAGKSTFTSSSTSAGSVINQGNLTAALGGYIALLAPQVQNQGMIVAKLGTVALASGSQTTLQFNGNQLVTLQVDQSVINAMVSNQQLVQADGGYVIMAANSANALLNSVINNSGTISAKTLSNQQGRILLQSTGQGVVQVGGTLDVSGSTTGSTGGGVVVTGDKVLVSTGAQINATGDAGGGTINIGGGWQGADPSIANANAVVVQSGAVLNASALTQGNGGQVVVYSNTQNASGVTNVAGTVLAQGGRVSGNGGQIETSGHWVSTAGATISASALYGKSGQWLLDPYDVTIDNGTSATQLTTSSNVWAASSTSSEVSSTSISSLLSQGTSVTISTGTGGAGTGLITVNGAINQAQGASAASLTLQANSTIAINQPITINNSGSKLALDTGGSIVISAPVSADTLSIAMTGVGTTLTQAALTSGSSAVNTNNLFLNAPSSSILLTNPSNNIGVIAGNAQNINIYSNAGLDQNSIYGTGMYIGTVNGVSGLSSTGNINLTSNQNIFVNQNIATTSSANNAIVLSAGALLAAGTNSTNSINPYGPNVILGSGNTITTGAGGLAVVYTGSYGGSGASLESYVQNSATIGNSPFRYDATASTLGSSALSSATGIYAIYRENPTLTIAAQNATAVYGASLAPAVNVLVTGMVNGDTQTQALSSLGSISYGGATSTSGYLNAGTSTVIPIGAVSALGYGINYSSAQLTVTPATLTALATVTNNGSKVYDSTVTAYTTLTANGVITNSLNVSDQVTLSSTSSSYDTKNVGAGKAVTVSGITLSGADAGNYILTSNTAQTTGAITPLAIQTTFSASNKTYDGTTLATVTGSSSGILPGDVVSVLGTGNFSDANVSFGVSATPVSKTVNVTGVNLTGTDATNYSLLNTTATTSAVISPLVITQAFNAANKVYDGSTSATVVANNSQILAADAASVNIGFLSGSFSDQNVGVNKQVTITGAAITGVTGTNSAQNAIIAANYVLAPSASTTTASITPATLTVSGITASNKVYDGTTSATVSTAGVSISGFVNNESVSPSVVSATGVFSDKNAGNGKVVNLTVTEQANAVLSNYTIVNQATATASISPMVLAVTATVTGGGTKVYDTTRTASYSLSSNAIASDVNEVGGLILSSSAGIFSDANVGVNKIVTVSGISISGTEAGNYVLQNTSTQTTGTITPKPITVSGLTASNKVYDNTTSATLSGQASIASGATSATDGAVYSTDNVQLSNVAPVGTFSQSNVGSNLSVAISGLSLTGTNASNYSIVMPTNVTASITPRPITAVGITALNKVYDDTSNATLNFSGAMLASGGVLGSDNPLLQTSEAQGSFVAGKNVGNNLAVSVTGLSLTGAGAQNYTVTDASNATANITPKVLTVSGITAQSKSYDGNASALVNFSGASLSSGATSANDSKVYSGDQVQLQTSQATGVFSAGADPGAYKNIAISGLSLSGSAAGNYVLAPVNGVKANIMPLQLKNDCVSNANCLVNPASVASPVSSINNLSTPGLADAARLLSNDIASLSPTTLGSMVSLLSADQMSAVTAAQFKSLPSDAQATVLAQLNQSSSGVQGLLTSSPVSSTQVTAAATGDTVSSAQQLQSLADVRSLSPAKVARLSNKALQADMSAMSANQLMAITLKQAARLPETEQQTLNGLLQNVSQVRQLNLNEVKALSGQSLSSAIKYMGSSQLLAITAQQIRTLPQQSRQELLLQLDAVARGRAL